MHLRVQSVVLILISCIAAGPALGRVVFVDRSARGNATGTSWSDAYRILQEALEDTQSGDEIWIAQGRYIPSKAASQGQSRTACFAINDDLRVYGGFPTGGSAWSERDPGRYETILSGDLSRNDGPNFSNTAENCYHVVTTHGGAVLDGLVISGGNANALGFDLHMLGGGILVDGEAPFLEIRTCLVQDNQATNGAGMASAGDGTITITGSTFYHNAAAEGAGGLLIGNLFSITHCRFLGNVAVTGAAIFCSDQSDGISRCVNCVFNGNQADVQGGAINFAHLTLLEAMLDPSKAHLIRPWIDPEVVNCTFVANEVVQGDGGGVYCLLAGPVIRNCIFWDNSSTAGSNESTQIGIFSAQIDIGHSVVMGWTGQYGGEGNISLDPSLVNPAGPDGRVGTLDDDVSLQDMSPCIDAGDNSALPPDSQDLDGDGDTEEPLPLDLAGNMRLVDGPVPDSGLGAAPLVDMGAFESQTTGGNVSSPVIYVDGTALSGGGNGTSWQDAYIHLQDALADAGARETATEIWVAQGTYRPDCDRTHPNGNRDRSASFIMQDNIVWCGGFPAGGSDLETRDPAVFQTILSGDLAGNDQPDFVQAEENSYHVVLARDTHSSAVIDGFTITGGRADGANKDLIGGGIWIDGGDGPIVRLCRLQTNWAVTGGGGIGITDGAKPTISICDFIENAATGPGYFREIPCNGGALCIWGGAAQVVASRFLGNKAESGGAVSSRSSNGDVLILANCLFSGNSAYQDGGAVWIEGTETQQATLWLGNSSFFANESYERAGGILLEHCSATIINSIVWASTAANAQDESAQVTVDENTMMMLYYSTIMGWSGSHPGFGNRGSDPCYVDPWGADLEAGTLDDNLRLSKDSPCIDAGMDLGLAPTIMGLDPTIDPARPDALDIAGNPRLIDMPTVADTGLGEPIDIGAYEMDTLLDVIVRDLKKNTMSIPRP